VTLTDEKIAELKAKYGELHQLSHDGESVVVTRPNRQQWKKFRAFMNDDRKRGDAIESLLRECVVHPSLDELNSLLEVKPGLAEAFGSSVVELAGAAKTEAVEKKVL